MRRRREARGGLCVGVEVRMQLRVGPFFVARVRQHLARTSRADTVQDMT